MYSPGAHENVDSGACISFSVLQHLGGLAPHINSSGGHAKAGGLSVSALQHLGGLTPQMSSPGVHANGMGVDRVATRSDEIKISETICGRQC
jgi:hypothetical protein